ncbi:MAG: hypothetical protein CBC09_01045 [Cellvibrionales bacterium TMED49]|nr:hypothetical protein [Porticoccaceae bacterium]OUU40024.1 MAG: hypothetical protein CBC09_01045 [Cellvibrionales bacterium TMED49]
MEGWLYVMSNESLRPGLVKIGRSNDLRQHARDLYTRGVAAPFKIAYRGFVEECEAIEKKVHLALEDCRLSSERDFFECSIAKAILTIQESSHIMSEDVYVKDEHQLEEEKKARKQDKLLLQYNEKTKKDRKQYIEDEGIWLDKPSFYITIFLGLVAFILFPQMDEYFRDNSAIKWFLAAIPPYIYWHFASKKYSRNYRELETKAEKLYPLASSYDTIAPPESSDGSSEITEDGQRSTPEERLIEELTFSEVKDNSNEANLTESEPDALVAQVTQPKISWVCHYCATDNSSEPANQVVCIRCNRASSMEHIL